MCWSDLGNPIFADCPSTVINYFVTIQVGLGITLNPEQLHYFPLFIILTNGVTTRSNRNIL